MADNTAKVGELTILQHFAGAALTGLLARGGTVSDPDAPQRYAQLAFEHAVAMVLRMSTISDPVDSRLQEMERELTEARALIATLRAKADTGKEKNND